MEINLKITNIRCFVAASVASLFLSFNVDAARLYTIRPNERVLLKIAAKDINRIAVTGDRIKSVYGTQDRAHIVADEENGQIFITPKQLNNKSFSISLVTEKGSTIDLTLLPGERNSETILLTLDKKAPKLKPFYSVKHSQEPVKPNQKISYNSEQEIKALVEAVILNKQIAAYSLQVLEDKSADRDAKGLVQTKLYTGIKYKILVFSYTNLKESPEVITEQMFKLNDKIVGVTLLKKSLLPGEATTVIVVEENAKR